MIEEQNKELDNIIEVYRLAKEATTERKRFIGLRKFDGKIYKDQIGTEEFYKCVGKIDKISNYKELEKYPCFNQLEVEQQHILSLYASSKSKIRNEYLNNNLVFKEAKKILKGLPMLSSICGVE